MKKTLAKAGDRKQSSFSPAETEIPYIFSRGKGLQYIKARHEVTGKEIRGRASREAINKMYELYLKIGAMNELPEKQHHIENFLSDFWRTLYLENPLVPDDIPFDVIMDEFSGRLVRGEVRRRGNNQSSLSKAFNSLIREPQNRNLLYRLRDQRYPNDRPRRLGPGAGYADKQEEAEFNELIRGKPIEAWPDKVIIKQFRLLTEQIYSGQRGREIIEAFAMNAYTRKIISEAEKRGFITKKEQADGNKNR